MSRSAAALALLAALLAFAPLARAFEVPPEGACATRAVQWTPDTGPAADDVVPPAWRPGDRIEFGDFERLHGWLPEEVWERRDLFFFEGMLLEVGPCYRRYPEPPYFTQATQANAGRASLDSAGNLSGYAGTGLPFAPESIGDDAPDAGLRWAWNYRYRFLGSGFRGAFRISEVTRGGRGVTGFMGNVFFVPLHGVPGGPGAGRDDRFVAGGSFSAPESARGMAWRQFQKIAAETDYQTTDDVFVYLPGQRKVRRAPPQHSDGVFMPSYTRGNSLDNVGMTVNEQINEVGNPAMSAAEPIRRGFVGLVIRPNAYTWKLEGVRDVLAPANGKARGYPSDDKRNYGPSGLSLASDRWDLRRALVINGERKDAEGSVKRVALWIDALTLQPLYWISRRGSGAVYEVGIFSARFSADDLIDPKWAGSGTGFGVMLPVAQSFAVAGQGGGWLRESYSLRTDPPDADDTKDYLSIQGLQRKGR
jgi:Protein of unknown function (DUF1329)